MKSLRGYKMQDLKEKLLDYLETNNLKWRD